MTSFTWNKLNNPYTNEDVYYLEDTTIPQGRQSTDYNQGLCEGQFRLYIKYTPSKPQRIHNVDLFHGEFANHIAQLNYATTPLSLNKLPSIFNKINRIILTHLI